MKNTCTYLHCFVLLHMNNYGNFYTISQYARLIQVSRRTIYNWIDAKNFSRFDVVLLNGRQMIKPKDKPAPENKEIPKFTLSELLATSFYLKLNPEKNKNNILGLVETELDSRLSLVADVVHADSHE